MRAYLGNLNPLGLVLPVGVLERVLVLEGGAGGVDTATVRTVHELLLELAREVAAAKLGIPRAIPHVVPATKTHDVHVASLVKSLERLDGAVAAVGAGHDDLGVRLVREDLLNLRKEVGVLLLVHNHLLASLGVVPGLGEDEGHVDKATRRVGKVVGRVLAGVVADLVELAVGTDVEDGVVQLREEAAGLLPVSNALIRVLRGNLLDVLDLAGEVEARGTGGDVDAARGALFGGLDQEMSRDEKFVRLHSTHDTDF